jgi:hypothetical protein
MLCNCINPHDDLGRCRVCGLRTDTGFMLYVDGLGIGSWQRILHEGPVTQWYWWHPNCGWVKDGPCATSEMAALELYPVRLGDYEDNQTEEIARTTWQKRTQAYAS